MITCERNLQILQLHKDGIKTKHIANALGLSSGHVSNIISRLKYIEELNDEKMDRWLAKESKVLSEHYMDWLLFLSGEAK